MPAYLAGSEESAMIVVPACHYSAVADKSRGISRKSASRRWMSALPFGDSSIIATAYVRFMARRVLSADKEACIIVVVGPSEGAGVGRGNVCRQSC